MGEGYHSRPRPACLPMNDTARASQPCPCLHTHRSARPRRCRVSVFHLGPAAAVSESCCRACPFCRSRRIGWCGAACSRSLWLRMRGEIGQVWAALREPTTRWRLCASATLISINWITYVWGIATNRVVETSLGYFINPLVNVLLGVLLLSERLNRRTVDCGRDRRGGRQLADLDGRASAVDLAHPGVLVRPLRPGAQGRPGRRAPRLRQRDAAAAAARHRAT